MLPRAQRLPSTAFNVAFSNGRVLRHPLLQVRVYQRLGTPAVSHTPIVSDALQSTLIAGTDVGEASAQLVKHAKPQAYPQVVRVAFVVSKKQGKATVRNRLRRRLRECYRLHPARAADKNDVLQGCDLIFMAMPAAHAANNEQLTDALTQLLRRAAASRQTPRENREVTRCVNVGIKVL